MATKPNSGWSDDEWAFLGKLLISILCALLVAFFVGAACNFCAASQLVTGWFEAVAFLTTLGTVFNA